MIPGSTARSDIRTSSLVIALLGVVIAAAYCNSVSIGFQFDDWHVLEQNPAIRSLRSIPRFFVDCRSTTVLRENAALRPLLMTTFALNYALSGRATWSYHLLNMLLHWVAVVLIFRIVRDHLWLDEGRNAIAACAALIVAVHPLNTEPLDYISARSALLTTVLYLGAFDAAVRNRRLSAAALFAAALLTKEIALTFPFVLCGYWLIARQQQIPERRTPLPWSFLTALLGIDVAAFLYRVLLLPAWVFQSTHDARLTPAIYFMTEWSAYLYYLRLFIWPDALVVDRLDYPLATSILQIQAWGSLALLAVLAACAWRARRRWPALTFAAFWFLATLATESSVFPLAEPVNEHRPYLGMLGLGTLAAIALWQANGILARRYAAPPAWMFAVTVTLIATALAASTIGRNQTWHGAYSLWLDATRKAPRNPRAWLNAGRAAMDRDPAEARRLLLRGHELSPCYAYVQLNLSALDARSGALDRSLAWADDGVRCNPELTLTHYYRGAALERLNRNSEAIVAYQRATAIDPQYVDAWLAQGRLQEKDGHWQQAAAAYDAALAADPTSSDAALRAALVYHYRLKQPGRAVERYRTVLALVPTHYGAHYQIAMALLADGKADEARSAWRAFVPLAKAQGDHASLDGAPAALRDAS